MVNFQSFTANNWILVTCGVQFVLVALGKKRNIEALQIF